jgi:hypothetical protein
MRKIQSNLKSLFLIGALIPFIMTSCDLFEKEASIDTSQLVGLWTISDADVVPEIGGLPIKNYFTDIIGMSGLEAEAFAAIYDAFLKDSFGGTIEFKDDNTYVFSIAGEIEDGTWALNSDGDKIIIDGGTSDEQLITILELTKSTLKVSYDELSMEDIDDNPDTMDVEVAMKIEMTLTK